MNRSNSFVSSLKWWPLQGHNNQAAAAAAAPASPTNNGSCSNVSASYHSKTATFGSSVAVQKLRESKWFKREEQRIFCAVVECGFIVELRSACCRSNRNRNSSSSYDQSDDSSTQDENDLPPPTWFGIVLCKTAKDNKPKPETIEIFSIKIRENGTFRMIKMPLEEMWNQGWELRINNFGDKEKQPHNEKDIRNQISFARKAKQSLWNNNKHFAYWCRYGSRQQDVRKRQMSECVKWGSVGMNAGMLLVMNKQKSLSTSK